MSQFFEIHPDNPQLRLIHQAIAIIHAGGVIAYPTDSCYALGCHIGDKEAVARIRAIRRLDQKHHLTLMCRDLRDVATYARLDDTAYRLLKRLTPGPYTFLLRATREVPRRLQTPKRKQIGVRIPGKQIVLQLLEELKQPLISTTLIMPEDEMPLIDPHQIRNLLEHQVDLIIDGGFCGPDPTTIVDLTGDQARILRQGMGKLD